MHPADPLARWLALVLAPGQRGVAGAAGAATETTAEAYYG